MNTLTDEQISEIISAIDFKQMVTADDVFYLVARAVESALLAASQPEQAKNIPLEEIGLILNDVMETAVKNGANSVSMPDEYVAVAHFLSHPKQYGIGQPQAQPSEAYETLRKAFVNAEKEIAHLTESRDSLIAELDRLRMQPAAQPAQDDGLSMSMFASRAELGKERERIREEREAQPAQEPQPVAWMYLLSDGKLEGAYVTFQRNDANPNEVPLFTAPQADTTRKAVEAMREAAARIIENTPEMKNKKTYSPGDVAYELDAATRNIRAIDIDAVIESVRGE